MLGRIYAGQNCSAARALEIVGERWTLLILRDALFRGISRFSEFQRSLGVATNILANRLDTLVENGVLERRSEPGAAAADYWPTEKGLDFKTAIMALTEWGDRWSAPQGRPVTFHHADCPGELKVTLACTKCGMRPPLGEVRAVPVPRTERP